MSCNYFQTCETHLKDFLSILNQAVGLIIEICHHTSKKNLKFVDCPLPNSHLIYDCQI